jgi:energy-coupling factor transport system permease protein
MASWSLIVRMAIIFAVVGTIFNVLTYHGGDRELFVLPDSLPIVGGAVTFNALLYGVLSGLALLILVLVGTTAGALINWSELLRRLPNRLMPIAVAGTVAFAFVPQTAHAFQQIRESQLARGHRIRGARDLVPLLVPLLTLGLERAISLSESMESRGFGAPTGSKATNAGWKRAGAIVSLTCIVLAGYFLAVGRSGAAALALVIGLGLFAVSLRGGESHRTILRKSPLRTRDWIVFATSAAAFVVIFVVLAVDPGALRYEPYPSVTIPRVNIVLLLAIAMLMAPAFMTPTESSAGND